MKVSEGLFIFVFRGQPFFTFIFSFVSIDNMPLPKIGLHAVLISFMALLLGQVLQLRYKAHMELDSSIERIFEQFPRYLGIDETSRPNAKPKRVYLIGDSLIELSFNPLNDFPLGSALSHVFRRRADVFNRGLSGYSTKWMSSQFDRIKSELQEAPDVFMVVLLVGTNDSVLDGNPHHVGLDEFKNNLAKMVSEINTLSPFAAVMLVTPPPCSLPLINGPNSKLSKSGRARSNESVEKYAAVVREVAGAPDNKQVLLADLHANLSKAHVEDYLSDGVHLNGNGYKVLFVLIFQALEAFEGDLIPLPLTEPHFSVKIKQSLNS